MRYFNYKFVLFLFLLIFLAGCGAGGNSDAYKTVGMDVGVDSVAWQTPAGPGQELVTDHYRIFTTVKRKQITRHLPGYMEAAHQYYLDLTGLSDRPSDKRKAMYVLANRKQWASLTVDKMGPRSAPYMNIGAGGYCHAGVCVLWDIGTRGTLSVAGHEGLHQFLHWRMKDQLPMWIEEGICSQVEGHDIDGFTVRFTPKNNPARENSLRNAIVNNKWIEIPKLLPMDAGDVVGKDNTRAVGYYGQLWALVLFLQQHPQYSHGFKTLFKDAQDGKLNEKLNVPAAKWNALKRAGRAYNRIVSIPLFTTYITKDFDTFNKEYRAFAKKLAKLN